MLELIRQRLLSKTYITALILTTLSAIEINFSIISQLFPNEYRDYLVFIWPVLMLTLREVTSVALSEK